MTAVLSPGLPSFLQLQGYDQISDSSSDPWSSHFTSHIPMTFNQWPEASETPMRGMHDTDLQMFHSESRDYEDSFHGSTSSFVSPEISFLPEPSWGSDIDMATPSSTGFANDNLDAYPPYRPSPTSHYLGLPGRRNSKSQIVHSPQSSAASPLQQYAKLADVDRKPQRPPITRCGTAPELPTQRQKQASPVSNRAGSADGPADEEDYAPSEEAKRRGRKRQRIPHTAVERRYRENLNAHLDRLRQNVPALSSKRASGGLRPGDSLAEGVKPSKCEILNGAIEHITALGSENVALKAQNKTLQARLDELERWYVSVRA